MTSAETIYARLPNRLQDIGVAVFGYAWRARRQGGNFTRYRDEFLARESLDEDGWRAWQTGALRTHLRAAWQAPHYRSAWSAEGVELGDLERFTSSDLARLPVTNKEQVRQDPAALCPGGRPARGTHVVRTSGSTGTPLDLYVSADELRLSTALRDARYRSFAGVGYSVPRATFSGRRVQPDPSSRGPFHRYSPAERQLYFSPYHLGPDSVAQYVDALRRHGSRWITGYARSLHDLARLALTADLECPSLDAAIPTAEAVGDRLREDMSAAFGCRVHEEYGMVENCCFALECESGSLHVSPDAGIVEVLDADDEPCPPGEVGRVVATSLMRRYQPLIRYEIGDLAEWAAGSCECGRPMPVLAQIEGRVDDVVVGADGRRVSRLTAVVRGLDGIAATQFVQDRPGAVSVRVVCDGPLTDATSEAIRDRLLERLGSGTHVDVGKVDSLPRTPGGKIRAVVSNVPEGS